MISGDVKYPVATIAPYGPTNTHATKLVVAIFPRRQPEPSAIRKWFVQDGDARQDATVNEEVTAFLKEHQITQVVMADRLMGCPHEEAIDYPVGADCPWCPYWAGRNRFSHRKITEVGRNDPCPCGSGKKFKKCCGAV